MAASQFPNVPSGEHMTDAQVLTLVALERTGGCISLVGVMLIFVAYWLVPGVRNVQNTFIVFASVSNVGASIASAIAMDGLFRGRESGLCQAQSFLFEMFMQSDPWWALAMAINVFLVFYFRASPSSFQKWWWLYCLICYGGPFIIALSLLLVRHSERGPVYGEATIWCWVDREWDDIRIYTYYMLIWVCIVGSIILYFMVGYRVFRNRDRLRSFPTTTKSREAAPADDDAMKMMLPEVPMVGFYGTVITEVQVIHSAASSSTTPSKPRKARLPTVSFEADTDESNAPPAASQYFSTVTADPANRRSQPHRPHRHHSHHSRRRRSDSSKSTTAVVRRVRSALGKFVVGDPIKCAYLRTSFLFGLSVLVTWIPSSLNRIHSWLSGESPYEYHVATAAVLPLQGLWNAVIFFVTSSTALVKGWRAWRGLGDRGPGGGGGKMAAAEEEEGGYSGGGGGAASSGARRGAAVGDVESGEYSDEGEVGTLGSDVELRRMIETPGHRSSL